MTGAPADEVVTRVPSGMFRLLGIGSLDAPTPGTKTVVAVVTVGGRTAVVALSVKVPVLSLMLFGRIGIRPAANANAWASSSALA